MKRLECLDGVRGTLALYVLLSHMVPFSALPLWLIRPLSHGQAAVDVFFMLSGLVIFRSLESHRYAAGPFLIARVARIFPVYLVMLTVGIAIEALPSSFASMPWVAPNSIARDIWSQGWPPNWPADIVAHLTMTHGLLPNAVLPDVWVSLLGAAWSLSTEWQFYVLVLCLGRIRIGPDRLAAAFVGLAVIGLIWDVTAPEIWRFSRAFLPNKAEYFALGIASAAWIDRRSIRTFVLVLIATIVLGVAHGQPDKALAPLIWTACIAAQMFPRRLWILAIPLDSGVARYLGAVSYPLYLANEPLQKGLGFVLARVAHGDGVLFTAIWLPAAALVPLIAAAWLHHSVEIPAMRLGRMLTDRANGRDATTIGVRP